jgi:hypothetical protein
MLVYAEWLEAFMNRLVQTVLIRSAIPTLALGVVLMLVGPTAALAQRGSGGGRGRPLAAVIPAARFQAVVAAMLPRLMRAAATRAVDGLLLPRPMRAAGITAADAHTLVEEAVTTLAAFMPAEAIITAGASGLVLTMATGSAFLSVGVTIRVQVAVIMTDGAIGSLLRAIRICPPVTNRVTTGDLGLVRTRERPSCSRFLFFGSSLRI